MTGFFARPEARPLDAGVAVFETRPFAFFGVAFGVSLTVSAAFFLIGSVRLGLFEAAKKSEVVVSSSSGVGSRLTFFGGGFLGVAFFGLQNHELDVSGRVYNAYLSSSSSSESSTTLLARPVFLGAAVFAAGPCEP